MGRDRKYVLIGAFGIGAVILVLVTALTVGSLRLFSPQQEFVLYFDESVNGLLIGAPIKFRGIAVGRVSDLRLRFNQRIDSTAVSVFGEVDGRRIREALGVDVDFGNPDHTLALVSAGLRGRLELESLITGQLFVELDYFEEPGAPFRLHQRSETVINEIPTSPSVMARVGTTTSELFARLGSIDIEGINERFKVLLDRTNALLIDINVAEISRAFVEAADSFTALVGDGKIDDLLLEAKATLAAYHKLAEDVGDEFVPLAADTREFLVRLTTTLDALDEAAEAVGATLGPDSSLRLDISGAMREFTMAARAMRELAEFLERNPGALLHGRERR